MPALSVDGRFVAFASEDSTVVPGDTNGQFDGNGKVFLYDRVTGMTERISPPVAGLLPDHLG
ncbi:hypothetical protein K1W54_03095 [Micromonospora sp. CPCC 205371]|nr:hypothetical protein [Micromonospora sp. CPCC 205371]